MADKSEEKKAVFDVLNNVNVNEHTETKDTGKVRLTYLSWAWAWAEAKKRYPDANYEIIKFNGIPYVYDEKTGYMVYTTVTIEGITHEMWLPVMDGNNRAMKADPYKVTFKNGSSITIQAATMMDINKTIMRCLAKNLAMFGLGLYIYAGEDLPENPEDAGETKNSEKKTTQKKREVKKAEPEVKAEQVNEPTEEDKQAFRELQAFIKDNGLNGNDIASACCLTKNSRKEDFENALEYARTISMIGGEI